MARIPIIKLNNGTTSYYPLSVGESTVTTHNIEVKNNLGGYQKGETIPAVTTYDEILTTIFENEGGSDIVIDNDTIIRNEYDELCVNKEEIFNDLKCDQVVATKGLMLNSIEQLNGKVTVSTRAIDKEDIPVLDITGVNGLESRLEAVEAPLTKDQIPDIDISQVTGLSTKLTETIDESRLPEISMDKIDGLSDALKTPKVEDWGPWTIDGETGECTRIFWDDSQWKYKNDDGILVTFDSGLPSRTDIDAYELTLSDVTYVRSKTSNNSVVTKEGLKRSLTAEDTTVYDSVSSDKSIVGRIKALETGSGSGTVKSVNNVEPDADSGNVVLSELHADSEDKIWKTYDKDEYRVKRICTSDASSTIRQKVIFSQVFNCYLVTTESKIYKMPNTDTGKSYQMSWQNGTISDIIEFNKTLWIATPNAVYTIDKETYKFVKSCDLTSISEYYGYRFTVNGSSLYLINAQNNKCIVYQLSDSTTWTLLFDKIVSLSLGGFNQQYVTFDNNFYFILNHHVYKLDMTEETVTDCNVPESGSIYNLFIGDNNLYCVSYATNIYKTADAKIWTLVSRVVEGSTKLDDICYIDDITALAIYDDGSAVYSSNDQLKTWKKIGEFSDVVTNFNYISVDSVNDKVLLNSGNNICQYKANWNIQILTTDNVDTYASTLIRNKIDIAQTAQAAEVNNTLASIKFSEADTVEINNMGDVVKTLKNILIKLGLPEDSITINSAAFGS